MNFRRKVKAIIEAHKRTTTDDEFDLPKKSNALDIKPIGTATNKPSKKPAKLPVIKKVKGKIRKLKPETLAYIKKVKDEEAAKKKPQDLAHTEIPFREKVKDILEDNEKLTPLQKRVRAKHAAAARADMKRAKDLDDYIKQRGMPTRREYTKMLKDGGQAKKESQTESSDHAFYQKLKALSSGKKSQSILEKKSKTIKLLIGKLKPCGEKSKDVSESGLKKLRRKLRSSEGEPKIGSQLPRSNRRNWLLQTREKKRDQTERWMKPAKSKVKSQKVNGEDEGTWTLNHRIDSPVL